MNILFAIVFTLIIYPIIYFLPIRFSAKQKFLLLLISLLISLVGILSKNVIPFWQTILLMIAFVGLATIFISKRMAEITQNEPTFYDEIGIYNTNTSDFSKSFLAEKKETYIEDIIEEIEARELKENNEIEDIVSEEINEKVYSFEEIFEPLSAEKISELYWEEEIIEEQSIGPKSEELYVDLYVSAAKEIDKELEELEVFEAQKKSVETKQNNTSEYLSEIERLLNEEETSVTINEHSTKPSTLKEFKLEKLF